MRPIPILVDDRETAAVSALLRQSPAIDVAITRLKLGDYLVDGRLLFERKTVNDLVVSIIDGRLFLQARRLASAPLRAALIVEGPDEALAGSGMSWEAVQGALVTTSLFFGIPLLRARSPDETARTILYAARQAATIATGALPRHSYRPAGKRGLQLHILQGLPGIGPERARRLLDRFGSVQAAIECPVDALCSIKGIGRRGAEKIRWAVGEAPCRYGE